MVSKTRSLGIGRRGKVVCHSTWALRRNGCDSEFTGRDWPRNPLEDTIIGWPLVPMHNMVCEGHRIRSVVVCWKVKVPALGASGFDKLVRKESVKRLVRRRKVGFSKHKKQAIIVQKVLKDPFRQ